MDVKNLFGKNRELNEDVYRNIVSLKKSQDLFDDLYDGLEDESELMQLAQATESRIKSHIPSDMISRGFHYSTAIEYPFKPESYLSTRYSNGTFPCWYGGINDMTTIYETAYHSLIGEMAIEGVGYLEEDIIRERVIYKVHCKSIMIDLVGKQIDNPYLISNSYVETQNIGNLISSEGHPGILYPSARRPGGEYIAVFNINLLSNPRISYYCKYIINPKNETVKVKRSNKIILEAKLSDLQA